MQVNVHYTTQLKAALGMAEEVVELPSSAGVRNLLQCLAARHAAPFGELVLTPDGELLPTILLCVNDQQVDPAADDPLPEGATVTFLSAISGG